MTDCRFDDHLEGEFHAGRGKPQLQYCLSAKSAQTAAEIVDGALVEKSSDRRQQGVTNVPMQRRHGAIFYAALKSVAHDQIVTRLEFFDEGIKRSEIVAVIRVAHDHELSMSGLDPHLQCIAIAALRDDDDARPKGFRDFNRSVGATVVGDDDLAQKTLSREK